MNSRLMLAAMGVLFTCGSALAAAAQPAKFTQKPAATRTGETVTITFAVDRETDVAVYVEDAKGAIVRHLAAGVLGKSAPAPLKAGSLEQSLVWDGKDDDGQAAAGGPFQVRVGLGLKANWGGVAFAAADKTGPNSVEGVMGLAAGPDGRVYVLDKVSAWLYWHGTKMHVFRRDGSYEKTIKPFPSNTPVDRAKATGAFVNSFGGFNPAIERPLHLSFYSHEDVAQQPAITPDGRIVLAVCNSDNFEKTVGPAALAMMDTEGGVPEAAFAGANLKAGWSSLPALASAGDGKSVYLTGLVPSGSGRGGKGSHAVYRVALPDRGPAEPFFGDPAASGSDNAHLNDPRCVAVDGKGGLWVADFGNNRVVVLNEKDKKVISTIPVESPTWVAVHPKTGEVYVASRTSKQASVVKFSFLQNAPKEQARLDLTALLEKIAQVYRNRTNLVFALDSSADPAMVWVGCGATLARCEDQGAKFGQLASADCYNPPLYWRPATDPLRRELVCRITGSKGNELIVMDEATGKTRTFDKEIAGVEGRTHRLGRDGRIYAQDHNGGILRYSRDGKVEPFEATAKDAELKGRLPAGGSGTTMWERDFCIDRQGLMYVRKRGPEYHGLYTVEVYDQGGNHKRTVLWAVSDGLYGPRVDNQGNIYVMEAVNPIGQPFPDEFKGRFRNKTAPDWAAWIYGSVIKFAPAGGAVWFAGGQALSLTYGDGWRVGTIAYENVAPKVKDLRVTGGNLTGTIVGKTAVVCIPLTAVDAAVVKKVTFRLKNSTPATKASLYYNQVGEKYGTDSKVKSIDIKPESDFTEYTIDMSGEKEWTGYTRMLTLSPADDASKGTFALDWVRVGEGDKATEWKFDTDDGPDKKLPADMKSEKVGSYHRPDENVLQGALWWKFGFSPMGDMGRGHGDPWCHCTGSDFDVDDFGRTFAPDTGRFRVGVLDTNGNEIMSFGGYGNQDNCGPESYVVDPATKVLRPRKTGDPAGLPSPSATPEIGLAWIVGLAVTDKYAYVDDVINKRILRVKLDYAATETAAVK